MIDANIRGRFRSVQGSRKGRTPGRLHAAAGRAWAGLESFENRVLLDGDHAGLPNPWVPGQGTVVVLDSASPVTSAARGRGVVAGQIQPTGGAADAGDLFRFTVTGPGTVVSAPVQSVVGASGTVTVTTSATHTFRVGERISIAGATQGGFNGVFSITSVTDRTFTYQNATTGTATGTITAQMSRDFVSVLADTILGTNNTTALNSTLDTRVTVFTDVNGAQQTVATGTNNGTLSIGLGGGQSPDGWAGFEGVVGQTYYVLVQRDTALGAGRTATGAYTLRVDASTVVLPLNTDPNGELGAASLPGTIAFRQDEIIYRVTTRDVPEANGVATFQAVSDNNDVLNPHIDVYGAQANASTRRGFLKQDTDAGRLTDSFLWVRSDRAQTYYVRVRADELGSNATPISRRSTGDLYVQVHTEPKPIDVDPQTRVASLNDAVGPLPKTFPPVPQPPPGDTPGAGRGLSVYRFVAQGTGAGIITAFSQAMPQPAIRALDQDGNFLDFNKGNGLAQIEIPVVGGRTYYVIGEGFDNAADGDFNLVIEAHHTFDPFQPVDDHLNSIVDGMNNPVRNPLLWRDATPIRFNDPFQLTDAEGVDVRDRGWLQTGVGRGRVYRSGDTDVFQFVPPLNQQSTYAGSDNNQNSPLYVGGNYAQVGTDPRTGQPYDQENIGVWSAGNFFPAGVTTESGNPQIPSGLDGPIFAMAVWNPGGGANPVLAVGGNFTTVFNGEVGQNIQLGNIAFRVFSAQLNQYVWSADPFSSANDAPILLNGPVYALGAGDVIPTVLQGVAGAELYVGGQFTTGGSNNVLALLNTPGGLGASTLNGGVTGTNAQVRTITFFDPPAAPSWPTKPTDPNDPFAVVPPNLVDPPLQVYFGGSFANGFATNPAITPYPDSPGFVPNVPVGNINQPGQANDYYIRDPNRSSPDVPGPITGLNNVARWGVRNLQSDPTDNPVLQGNGLPNGYHVTWGDGGTQADENFDDEADMWTMNNPPSPPTGTVFSGSNIRVTHNVGTAVQLARAGTNDKALQTTLTGAQTISFTFNNSGGGGGLTVAPHARALVRFRTGAANTIDTTATKVELLRNNAVVATFNAGTLTALRTTRTPTDTGIPEEVFQFDFPTGFDTIRFSAQNTAGYNDAFVIERISTLPTVGIATPTGYGVNGAVNALTVWDDPGVYATGPLAGQDIPARIIIGGQFTATGANSAAPGTGNTVTAAPAAVTTANIIAYNPNRPGVGAVTNAGGTLAASPRFEALVAAGLPLGPVRSLATWRPWVLNGNQIGNDQISTLMVGADVTQGGQTVGLLSQMTTSGQNTQGFVPFMVADAAIRTIVAFQQDEIGYSAGVNPDGRPQEFETLYIGGDFSQVLSLFPGTTDQQPVTVDHVARLRVDLANGDIGFRTLGGTQGISPGDVGTLPAGSPFAAGTSSVYSLAFFNDNIPGVWDRAERQSTRVQITIDDVPGDTLNSHIRVFDSTLAVVYENETIDPNGGPDPSGGNDPSFAPNTPFVFSVNVWAGEVYYVEVSGTNGSQGRYTLTVTTDALPPAEGEPTLAQPGAPSVPNTSGATAEDRSDFAYPVGEGNFANAPEIELSAAGFGRNYRNPTDANNPSAYSTRTWRVTSGGIVRNEFSDGPVIARPFDTQVYFFRAPNDGTVDVRLATFGILRGWQEILTDVTQVPNTVTNVPRTKQINSPLRGAIRVFNNDFVELGYNNGNPAVNGVADGLQYQAANQNLVPGDDGARTFFQHDPRVTINVRRGNIYYIQVESAYRETFAQNPDLVDWRWATGAYDLLVNATPSLNSVDDHWPDGFAGQLVDGFSGTAIPIDNTTGQGTINGAIVNIPAGPFSNPADADTFIYYAPNRGQVSIRVQATSPALQPRIRILEDVTNNVLAQSSGTPGGAANVSFPTEQGQRFFVVVDGAGTQGTYTVAVNGPAFADDFANSDVSPTDNTPITGWANAAPLQLNRFLGLFGRPNGSGTVGLTSGLIENAGDRDIFRFTAEAYEFATVVVTGLDSTLDPFVTVWEITRDGQDLQTFVRVGVNDDESGTSTSSRVTFSVTPGRDYYVEVRGSDEFQGRGRYTLAVNVAPTDDHPNRTDFPAGTTLDLVFDTLNFTSAGGADGTIGLQGDDDLFRFTAPATGAASLSVTRRLSSTLAIDMLVLDNNNAPLAGVTVTLAADGSSATANIPNVVQGVQYYILVRARGTLPANTTDTGEYRVQVSTTPSDDHANAGQFNLATPVVLSSLNGVGTATGILVPGTDTDLFRFTTLAQGNVTVRVTTPSSGLNPKILIFDAAQNQVFSATGNGDSAVVTFGASGASQLFYVLVSRADGAPPSASVGTYTLTINGSITGGGGGTGPDDFPNAGEFNDADANAVIGLDPRTGKGFINANISPAGDTDLFTFTAAGAGVVDVQIVTPAGGLVDGQVKLYNAARQLILSDAAGIPGATAALRFNATAGDRYYVLVEPVGAATGSYSVRVSAQPTTHYLYFPEGFAGATIDEFLPMVNPNGFAVDVQVFARYETGDNPDTPIYTGTLAAGQRGGITVSTRNNQAGSLVRIGVPYSLEIRSTGPIGATFSHYDFNSSVGEAFTNRTSTQWTIAEAHKDRNNYRDFLLFYNPGSTATSVTVQLLYTDGTVTTLTQSIDGLRRSGINFDADPRVTKNGRFGVRVTSDEPIVTSLTSYNLPLGGGDGLLADADGGSTRGVITNIASGGGAVSNVSFINTQNTPATVTITADYGRLDLPKVNRVVTVQPNRQFRLNLSDLGLVAGQTVGITYTSSVPVTASATQYKLGDGDSTTVATTAARSFFFGDLFVNPSLAGLKYIEQLGLYNPTNVAIDVSLRIVFADGSAPANRTVRVNANTFSFVAVDQLPPILARPSPTAFSLVLESQTPFVAALTHYDLFLNGGWAAGGSPLGLTTPLSSL